MSNKYKQKAGEYIASGTYGCVYKNPALKCANGIRPEGKVSKLMLKHNALEERDEYNNIDRIDPLFQYHYKKPDICKIPAEPNTLDDNNFDDCDLYNGNLRDFYILEQEDGGLSLDDFAKKFNRDIGTGPRSKMLNIREKEFIKIFFSMKNLFRGLYQMYEEGYYHRDIKSLNIVARPKGNSYDIRYIDWGLATYGRYWSRFSNSMYFVRSPETFVFADYTARTIRGKIANGVDRQTVIDDVIYSLEGTYRRSYASAILENYFVDRGDTVPNNLNPYLNVEQDMGTYVDLIANGTPQEINRTKFEIIRKSDVFSLGIVLIHMWTEILGIAFQPDITSKTVSRHHTYPSILKDIHRLILNMCCRTLNERFTPSQAFIEFDEIIKRIDSSYPLLIDQFRSARAVAVVPPPVTNQAHREVPLAPVAAVRFRRAAPVARKNCKQFKKTVKPKCNDQEGCTWVVRKGCLNTESNPENIPLVEPDDVIALEAPVAPAAPAAAQSSLKQGKRTYDLPKLYVQKKSCNPGKVFNPLTGYCIKSNGALAKKLRKDGIIN